MKKSTFDRIFNNIVPAVISGIMTSLVFPLISRSSYKCYLNTGEILIEQVPDSFCVTLIKILTLFSLFAFSWCLVRSVTFLIKRLHYWRKKIYTDNDINEIVEKGYRQLLNFIINKKELYNPSNPSFFWGLSFKDLFSIIHPLYRALITERTRPEERIKDYFRSGPQHVLGGKATLYQLSALLAVVNDLMAEFNSAQSASEFDPLLIRDYTDAKDMVNELTNLVKKINTDSSK